MSPVPQAVHWAAVSDDDLIDRIAGITVWRSAGQRAPHKPLLLLLTLARLLRGEDRLIAFADVDEPFRALLQSFGPPRKSYHPECPFWHLRSDGLSLCRLHHGAFDRHLIGIRPNYTVEVRASILEEEDGPMLRHGLQGAHNQRIWTPRSRELRPDRERLERRFEKFLNVS